MKKCSRFLAVCFLILIASMNVSAISTYPQEVADYLPPIVGKCENCGHQTLREMLSYGQWFDAGHSDCVHEQSIPTDRDKKEGRLVVHIQMCFDCGATATEEEIEYQYIHEYDQDRIMYDL